MRRITRGKALIGKGGFSIVNTGSTAIIFAALADGAGTTVSFPVSSVAFGDVVFQSFSKAVSGVTHSSEIAAAGTVAIRFQNETGGTVTLGTVTTSYLVLRA